MYADDLLLYTRHGEPQRALERLEGAVGMLTPWFCEIGVSIFIPKSQLRLFTRSRSGSRNIVLDVDGFEIR